MFFDPTDQKGLKWSGEAHKPSTALKVCFVFVFTNSSQTPFPFHFNFARERAILFALPVFNNLFGWSAAAGVKPTGGLIDPRPGDTQRPPLSSPLGKRGGSVASFSPVGVGTSPPSVSPVTGATLQEKNW